MAIVLQMSKKLVARPEIPPQARVTVRNYRGPQDISRWLEIRRQAFATETPAARPWTKDDFTAEVRDKPWWSPQRLWLAENLEHGGPVGAVILGLRTGGAQRRAVVHWLAVVPAWRHQGIGRLLMAHLEEDCWQLGYREIYLETHANWQAAVRLYRQLGFTSNKTIAQKITSRL